MARFINQNSLGAGWQFDFLDNEGVNTNPGFLGVLYHNNTAKRTYTFPDKDGTLATTADALANPMTTLGDIIVGGASGSPSRLAKGTDGQFLATVSGSPAWASSLPAFTVDGLTGNANADITLTGRNAGSANASHVGANWNGGVYVTPNTGDTTLRLQHPSSTPTIGHWVAYTADLYDATGRVTFGRVQLITTNVSGAGASTGDWVFSLMDAGTLSERLRLKSTGELVYSGRASLAASAAARASLNIPAGTAPSSPTQGDFWSVSGTVYYRDAVGNLKLGHNPMTALGDVAYGSTNGYPTRLAGNISATPAVLMSTGNGATANPPTWSTVTGSGQVVCNEAPVFTSSAGNIAPIRSTTYGGSNLSLAPIGTTVSRGTSGSPAALQNGDVYGGFQCSGRGANGFSSEVAGVVLKATQNWTDDAMGSVMEFRLPVQDTNYYDTPLILSGLTKLVDAFWVLQTRASDDAGASLRIQSGTDPLTPVAGDLWNSSGALKFYNGSTTFDLTASLSNPMTTLGDLIMGGADGAPTRRAGNTTTTPQFLKSLGSGGLATAPVWAQISASDLSDGVSGTGNLAKVTGPTFTGGKVTLASTAAGYASLNIPAGTAPSSPANGDIWNVGGELFWGNGSQVQQLTDVVTTTVGNGTLNLDGRLKSVVKIDLQGATTINMVNGGRDGQRLTLELKQDATGGHGITMGTGVAWGGDVTEYVPTTLPNKTDYVGLIYNATAATWRVIAIAKGY